MTATFAKLKSHFTNWREWELNPIVIKELRQAVRSWAVTGMLMLFLTVLFITSLVFLVGQSFEVSENMQLGGSMFSAFMVILAGASIFFIPLYVGVRVAAERQENNPDLLYVSTLSPVRIVFGKFLCGAYMAVLFFSACMPFMAFTNLLRGVDLPTVFVVLALLFLVVCAANMVAIFLACLPMSKPFKFLFIIYGIFQSFGIISALIGTSFVMMRSGMGAMMSGKDFWIEVATTVGIGAALTGLLFVLTVALVSPPSANRALPVRIYFTAIWLGGGLLAFSWVAQTGEGGLILSWTYPAFAMLVLALLVTISNSDQLSQRVRRTIPQAQWKRVLAFIFFNGAAGGLVWVAALMAATILITNEVVAMFPKSYVATTANEHWFVTTTAYAFAYALTALFIHRRFFAHRPPKLTGLLAVLLAGAWAIVPSIVLFFLNQLSWKSVEGLQLGNVFNVAFLREDSQLLDHLYFACGWLLVMLVINAKWFVRQMKNFQPPVPVTPENSPPVLN
jgi:hypothetical protein